MVISEVRVLDKLGSLKNIFKFGGTQSKVQINLDNLPKDVYVIQVFKFNKKTMKSYLITVQ